MKNIMKILVVVCAYILGSYSLLYSQVLLKNETFVVEQVLSDLSLPWAMVFLTKNQILFTEKQGRIKIFDLKTQKMSSVLGVPKVKFAGQGGLMDIALSPHFLQEKWVYLTYVKDQNGQGVTTLARAKLQQNQLIQWSDLLVTQSATGTSRHFGSRLTFDETGHLFVSVGDRGKRPNGQDLSTHAGSILRLKLDGSVPTDNPFVTTPNALPEIWSYGHRNPQGLFYDHATKLLWSIEHGPRGGDEINLIQAGKNYGWATISYGKEYWGPLAVGEGTHREGMEQPIKVYTPSIAPSSLVVYSGKAFPQWKGHLFAGALALRHLNKIKIDRSGKVISEQRLLQTLEERIRSITEDDQGLIYLSTDSGLILRIKPSP